MNPSRLSRTISYSVLVVLRSAVRSFGSSVGTFSCRSRLTRTPTFVTFGAAGCVPSTLGRLLSRRCGQSTLLQVEEHEGEERTSAGEHASLETMPVEDPKLGFVGAGMMSTAIINGVIAAKVTKPEHIVASDVYKPSLDRLSATGIRTADRNEQVVSGSDVVVLAVKPDVIPTVLREINEYLTADILVVSIAAGVPISSLEELAPGKRIIRVMPNTPCQVSETAAAFAPGTLATADDRELVRNLFGAVGYSCEVKETQLDAVTGLSGSGPAYIFMLIEALADGGVRMGLPREQALKLAAQTVKGAATMVLETGTHPGVLKDQVCSPGGTTIAGVEALEKNGFRAAAMAAVVAGTSRSLELREAKK